MTIDWAWIAAKTVIGFVAISIVVKYIIIPIVNNQQLSSTQKQWLGAAILMALSALLIYMDDVVGYIASLSQ